MALSRTRLANARAVDPPGSPLLGFTTSSFTPADNSLLVFMVGGQFAENATALISDTAGLTWTLRQQATVDADGAHYYLWTAPVTTGVSMTITVNTVFTTLYSYAYDLLNYTGHDAASPIGVTGFAESSLPSGGATWTWDPTLTLSGSPASNSEVITTCFIIHNGGTISLASNPSGSGWSTIQAADNVDQTSYDYRFGVYYDDTPSGTDVPWGEFGGTTAWNWAGVVHAFEVKAAAVAPTITLAYNTTAELTDNTSPHAFTSGSFTPTANRLLVVAVGAFIGSGGNNVVGDDWSLTDSSGTLTWTRRAMSRGGNAMRGGTVHDAEYVVVWTAPVGSSPGSITLTATCTSSNPNTARAQFHVFEVTDHHTGDPIVQVKETFNQGEGAVSFNLDTAPAATSALLAIRAMCTDGTGGSATPTADWTELADTFGPNGQVSMQSQWRAGTTSQAIAWTDTITGDTLYDPNVGVDAYVAIEFRHETAAAVLTANPGTLTLQGASVQVSRIGAAIGAFQPDAFQNDAFQTAAPSTGTYTLTVTGGTLQLQGASVNLLKTARIAVTAGTLQLQGASASVNAVRRISVTAGTLDLDGASVNLLATRRIAVTPGTLTLVGASSLLTASRLLTVTGGTLDLEGASVDLTYVQNVAYTIDVTGGTLDLDGGSVNLLKTSRVDVTPGTLVLEGASAGLSAIRRISVTAATLTLSGATTSLTAIRNISVNAGTLTLEGSSANLTVTRRLTVTAGTLQLVGASADLNFIPAGTFTINVNAGTLQLQGGQVELRHIIPYREPTGGSILRGGGSSHIVKVEDDGEIRLFARNWRLPKLTAPKVPLAVAPYRVRLQVTDAEVPALTAAAPKLRYDDTPEIERMLARMRPDGRQEERWELVPGEVRWASTPLGGRIEQHLWRSSSGREEWWAFRSEWGINARGELVLFHVWRSPRGRVERRAVPGLAVV